MGMWYAVERRKPCDAAGQVKLDEKRPVDRRTSGVLLLQEKFAGGRDSAGAGMPENPGVGDQEWK